MLLDAKCKSSTTVNFLIFNYLKHFSLISKSDIYLIFLLIAFNVKILWVQFSIFLLVLAVIILLYPVSTEADFYFLSTLNIFNNVVSILIPIFFFYLAWKPSPYRRAALFIAIGANIPVETFLAAIQAIFGYESRIFMFLLSVIFKATGLSMFSWGISDFTVKFSK